VGRGQGRCTDLRATLEVGVIVVFGMILPGVLIVLGLDRLIRWLL